MEFLGQSTNLLSVPAQLTPSRKMLPVPAPKCAELNATAPE